MVLKKPINFFLSTSIYCASSLFFDSLLYFIFFTVFLSDIFCLNGRDGDSVKGEWGRGWTYRRDDLQQMATQPGREPPPTASSANRFRRELNQVLTRQRHALASSSVLLFIVYSRLIIPKTSVITIRNFKHAQTTGPSPPGGRDGPAIGLGPSQEFARAIPSLGSERSKATPRLPADNNNADRSKYLDKMS